MDNIKVKKKTAAQGGVSIWRVSRVLRRKGVREKRSAFENIRKNKL